MLSEIKPSSLQMEAVSTAFEVVLDLVALYFVIFSQSKRINDIFIFWFHNKYARTYNLLTYVLFYQIWMNSSVPKKVNHNILPTESNNQCRNYETFMFVNVSVNQIVSDKWTITNIQNGLANLVLIGEKFVRIRNL